MTTQDHLHNIYNETKAMVEGLIASMTKEISDIKKTGEKISDSKKKELLTKKKDLTDKYHEYLQLLKKRANDAKDDLAEKVGELQKAIEEMRLD